MGHCVRVVRFWLLLAFVTGLLSACSHKVHKDTSASSSSTSSSGGRYQGKDQDWGPDQEIDMSHVPDAVPRYEQRTIAGNKNPYSVLGKTYFLMDDERAYKERGTASWYGYKFNGERTSNGELYDMFAMTGAHKTLPIPSYVRVTNLDNHKSVIVRINDRGPFHDGRIIDLSYAAAQRLGITRMGTGNVEVEVVVPDDDPRPPLRARKKELIAAQASRRALSVPSPSVTPPVVAPVTPAPAATQTPATLPNSGATAIDASKAQLAKEVAAQDSGIVSKTEAGVTGAGPALPPGTYLQIGAFGVEASARQFAATVGSKLSFPVIVSQVLMPNKLFRVRVGPFADAASLQRAREQLQKIDILQTHVVYQ